MVMFYRLWLWLLRRRAAKQQQIAWTVDRDGRVKTDKHQRRVELKARG